MIEIKGLNEMREQLRLLDQQVRTKFVLNAVRAGSQVIADAMVEVAPVLDGKTLGSDALEPGALRDDIKVRERLDKDGFADAHIGPGKRTAHVARWVEYGHRMIAGGQSKMLGNGKTRGPGHSTGLERVPEHPFLRPAFERSEAEAIEKFKSTMQEEIAGALK